MLSVHFSVTPLNAFMANTSDYFGIEPRSLEQYLK